jgi:NAD(P)-dependent dehydrogenase (short-subunit alcohol dehydrogenase family)
MIPYAGPGPFGRGYLNACSGDVAACHATKRMAGEVPRACSGGSTHPAVLVTGASSGIGRATALSLLAAGFRVFATVRKPGDSAALQGLGAEPLLLDVTSAVNLRRAVADVRRRLGTDPLAGLVNNAGISLCAPWEFVTAADLREQLEVNLVGAVEMTRAFLPLLRASRGRVVLISSTSGFFATPLLGPYCCSKFALEAFADSLRREVLRDGVQVTVIQPGPVRTPIFDKTRRWARQRHPQAWGPGVFANFDRMAKDFGRTGMPAEQVARSITRVLTCRRPPLRLVVAKNAWFFNFLPFVPKRWLDRIVVRVVFGAKPPKP